MAVEGKSADWFERACQCIPGGVNSPVRAFGAVGGTPRFMARGEGPYIYDVDGNRYVDMVLSWGPLIAGHAHPLVLEAVNRAAASGLTYGAPCPAEVELAETICQAFPAMEKIRMVNSGTEATMSAVRLARGFTGRSKIVKMAGCYHGHADQFLIAAGSGLLTAGVPNSPGVTSAVGSDTLIAQFNDLESIVRLFKEYGNDIAAVILEPLPANMGVVLPLPGYLDEIRDLTSSFGSLLIFDEVISGFRVGYGGMQTVLNIEPDLTCLGKIIGGGMPVGAYGGRQAIMSMVAPEGPVYQAGTLSGNPVAMAAGLATLKIMQDTDWYEGMEVLTYLLAKRLEAAADRAGIEVAVNHFGPLLTMFFGPDEVTNYQEAMSSNTDMYARFFHAMLKRGVYLPCSQYEAWFLSIMHTVDDIEMIGNAAEEALKEIAE
ncbi:MAG: glutamate-1-semialdehyde 2,1-aminomutase [Methylocystaceae bacterium]